MPDLLSLKIITGFTLLLATVVTLAIALFAFRRNALTRGGTLAALILGIIIFSFSSFVWFALLVTFFATSSLLTRYKAKRKEPIVKEFAKA